MALNMADLFEHAVDAFPDRVALIFGDRQVTYAELEDEANRLAHHLAAQGVGPGDHVGLYARNSIAAVETLLAIIKLRAVAININYRYLRGELAYHPRDADLSALVHDQDLAPGRGMPSYPADCLRVAIGADVAEALSPGQALSAASGARDFSPRSPDDIFIIYTGGTTGHPKGVMWRHEDFIWRTLRRRHRRSIRPASHWKHEWRAVHARAPRAMAWSAWPPRCSSTAAAMVAHAGRACSA